MNKARMILVLIPLFVISLLLSPAQVQSLDALADEKAFPKQQAEREASLGENRGALMGGSDIWTYEGQAGDILTIKAEADNPANDAYPQKRREAGLLDMMLIVSFNGTILAKANNIQPGMMTDSMIEGLQLPTDGTYKIEVFGLKKEGRGAYTLTLQAVGATPADPTPDPDLPTLTIENQLEESICYVYTWPTSIYELEQEWLGTKKIIVAGDSHQWFVPPDEYNMALTDCYGNTLARRWNFNLTNSSTLTVSPVDRPAAQCVEGMELFRDGQNAEALPLLEAGFAGRESATFANPDDEGKCTLALGILRDNIGNRSGALEAYQVALNIFQVSGDREGEGITLNNIGLVYQAQGQYGLALEQFQQALEIDREVGHRAMKGTILNNIGLVYQAQGQYGLALEQFQQALEIDREVGHRAMEGTILNNIGFVYQAQGQYGLALEQFQQALEIDREVGNRAMEGTILNNMGLVYQSQARYELALEHFMQALEISRQVDNRTMEGTTLNNIGLVYQAQEQYELALEHYHQALEIHREVGNRPMEGTTLNNIGGVYGHQGQYELALEQYNQALEIHREVGNRSMEGTSLNNIGGIYLNQGKYELANKYYNQALEIIREVGDRAGEGITLSNIGLAYEQQGQASEALFHYEPSHGCFRGSACHRW